MIINKLFLRFIAVFGLAMMFVVSGWGVELDTDIFSSNTDGWSGTNVTQESAKLRIDRDDTASKTFTFVGYENQTVDFSLDAIEIDNWESSDYLEIRVDGTLVFLNDSINGTETKTFSVTLNGSGSTTITITPNTNANAEDIYIDNIVITGTPVAQTAPTFSGTISNQTATQNSAYSFNTSTYFAQTNGDTITYSTNGMLPTGVTINSSTGILSGTPTNLGTFSGITIRATDNDGTTSSNSFTFTVNENSNYGANNPRDFAIAYTTNEKGNIKIIGNSVLWTASGCAAANTRNNLVTEVNTNVNGGTFNSSSAVLTLPQGVSSSNIKYAALQWQGRLAVGGLTSTTQAQARTAKIQLPGYGSYQSVTSIPGKFNWSKTSGNGDDYQGIADITEYLKHSIDTIPFSTINTTGYSQSISVADILTNANASNMYGGWSIVVVYNDDSVSLKNMVVYDGFLGVSTGNSPISIPLSGFLTPSSGSVNASFFIFGGEGDYNSGDKTTLTNAAGVEVALKSGGEVFDSSVTDEFGTNVTTRTPACGNTLGIDIHSFNIGTNGTPSIIGNGQSSTTVKLYSFSTGYADYDTHFPGLFAFATQLYIPDICYNETMTKNGVSINGQSINIGDVVDVNLSVSNRGSEDAKGVKVEKIFDQPTVLTYKSGSMSIRPIGGTSYIDKTDVFGDDTAEYDSSSASTVFRLGTGADESNGGTIAPYAVTDAHYSMQVLKYAPSINENTYYMSYSSDTLVNPISGVGVPKCTDFTNNISIVNPDLFTECGFFSDALSTRSECSGGLGGTISFSDRAMLHNNPDHDLATCTVTQGQYDATKSCESADCQALPGNSKSMELNYDNPPSAVNVTSTPASASAADITVNSMIAHAGSEYDAITYGWSAHTLTLSQPSYLNVNTVSLTANDSLVIASSTSVNIGSLTSTNNTGNSVTTTGNPTNISINNFSFGNGSTVNLTAKDTLYIGNFTVGRDNSTVVLKAEKVRLNTLTASNVGSGVAHITIEADEIDIGTLDMGQGAIVTIKPYTLGKEVFVKTNTIQASSSSTLLLSSGEYYTNTLDLPGTSDSSSVAVLDANQIVNFYINGNFTPGNNPGINSAGNGGNFGNVPSTTFRLLINGNVTTGGGGTTFNALVYAEGDVTLGSPTYVRGAISAQNSISLGVDTQVYYDENISDEIYASCENSYYTDADFDAWETTLTRTTAKLYTQIVSKPFTFNVGTVDDTLFNGVVCASVTNAGGTILSGGGYQCLDFTTASRPFSWTVTQAERIAKIQIKAKSGISANSIILETPDWTGFTDSNSSDSFAIRPDHFVFTTPIALMKAGEDYNLNVNAYTFSGVNALGYDQTVSNLTGAPTSWWNRDTAAQIMTVNTQGTTTIAGGGNFNNGAGSVPIRFSDVGKFTLKLSDTNWAVVDSGDGIAADVYTIQGDGNVTFIPWDFNISTGTIANNDGVSPSFTYLSRDLNMSARIPMTIRAQNKQGAITQNYANNMYERSITITPYVSSVEATARGLTPLTQGTTNADGNFISGSRTILYNDPLVARFNFDRNQTIAVSPFDVNSSNGVGNDVNISVSDSDSVYGDKNQTLGANATFVYGRFIPRDVRVFGANKAFTANGWYEVYNAPTIGTTGLAVSKNGGGWYINTLHSDLPASYDGDANVTYVNTTNVNIGGMAGTDGMEDYNFGATYNLGGYKAHIATDPWLWYGLNASTYADPNGINGCDTHPCFNINIVPPMGASGSAKTDATGNKANKKSDNSAGNGGFKSTNDYSPAVR